MRTLIITDLHLYEKPAGHLEAQKGAIIDIIAKHNQEVDKLIILGDVFMRRKPSPSELLAFNEVCNFINNVKLPTHILRGNHDSEDKSDNGRTVLSLYRSMYIMVHTQASIGTHESFIPHYEDESKIVDYLKVVPEGSKVFGHFGYNGCMNSMGDLDFGIDLKHFKNPTYLGHIHKYKQEGNVTILGTPWTTNFGEVGDWKGYHILEDDHLDAYTTLSGPKHLVMTLDELREDLVVVNHLSNQYFVLLRILLEPGEGMQDLPDELDVAHVDFKYKPTFDEENQSSWRPERELFQLNSQIIEDYVQGCVTSLDSSSIMAGYDIIKGGEELPDED